MRIDLHLWLSSELMSQATFRPRQHSSPNRDMGAFWLCVRPPLLVAVTVHIHPGVYDLHSLTHAAPFACTDYNPRDAESHTWCLRCRRVGAAPACGQPTPRQATTQSPANDAAPATQGHTMLQYGIVWSCNADLDQTYRRHRRERPIFIHLAL